MAEGMFNHPVSSFRPAPLRSHPRFPGAARLHRLFGWKEVELAHYLEVFRQYYLAAVAPPSARMIRVRHLEASFGPVKALNLSSRLYLPSLADALELELQQIALVRLASAAVAVERHRSQHNSLPACPEELVPDILSEVPIDPFSGMTIHYRVGDAGYVLWSVGPDGTDNHGTPPEEDVARPGEDITFVVQRWRTPRSAEPKAMGEDGDSAREDARPTFTSFSSGSAVTHRGSPAPAVRP